MELFLKVDTDGNPTPKTEADRDIQLKRIRLEHRLGGVHDDLTVPLLRDVGLWYALSEVITPGAMARIRESGTFYHCIEHNPSAVEFGIFWLRAASVLGKLFTVKETSGVYRIVEKLVEKIEGLVHQNVRVHPCHRVVEIGAAKFPNEVELSIEKTETKEKETETKESRSAFAFTARTDHVILAVPRHPLRKLNGPFPVDVKERIDGITPLPLLKAFVVTDNAWWHEGMGAQSYAWSVPTRELHFFGGRQPNTTDGDRASGMIMLYTDEPAIRYWSNLIPEEHRSSVWWVPFAVGMDADEKLEAGTEPGLLEVLVRRLLVLPYPGLVSRLERLRDEVFSKVRMASAGLADELAEARTKKDARLLGAAGQILEVLDEASEDVKAEHRGVIHNAMREVFYEQRRKAARSSGGADGESKKSDLPDDAAQWENTFRIAKCVREKGDIDTSMVTTAAGTVLAYGIRDWSAEPYGGATHLWAPGSSYAIDPNAQTR